LKSVAPQRLQQISVIAQALDESIENQGIQQFRRAESRRRRVISTQCANAPPRKDLKTISD
jgi:hypothetical protein